MVTFACTIVVFESKYAFVLYLSHKIYYEGKDWGLLADPSNEVPDPKLDFQGLFSDFLDT